MVKQVYSPSSINLVRFWYHNVHPIYHKKLFVNKKITHLKNCVMGGYDFLAGRNRLEKKKPATQLGSPVSLS